MDNYYQKMQGRAPRQLVLDVLKAFEVETPYKARTAIDLGSGDGTETLVLLVSGWHVLAIDGEPVAIQCLLQKTPEESLFRLETQVAKFEEVTLSSADLIHASFCLPFCQPQYFPEFWSKISNAVNPGGRFAGQFFGVKATWADNKDMTFQTAEQVRELFGDFEIGAFQELDEAGEAVSGPKHWHVFTVIAKKKKRRVYHTRSMFGLGSGLRPTFGISIHSP